MRILISCILLTLLLPSCLENDSYTPKRKGYFRIDFPEKQYVTYSSSCPFTFEYPTYAQVVKDTDANAEPCWLNIIFPKFKGKLYLSYKVIDTNLYKYLEESRNFVVKHEVKASAINEQTVINPKNRIYGEIFDIQGNAASNMQFYLTDSTTSFVRGALYFYSVPNKDSLEPVLQFIKKDIYHMVESFRWKEISDKSK
jgi:gliding motility-associated lipoprotein GldD